MRTIAVINQKGGCGKTTTAVNLAASFASRRFRTLLIDIDPQSHCAAALGITESRIERDISNALLAPLEAPLDADRLVWRISRGLDLVPSRTRLAGLEASRGGLSSVTDREHRLKSVIDRLSGISDDPAIEAGKYDVCLIDCPPSIGLLTFNALIAATDILIPVETSFFSMQGASKQLATIRSVARRLGVRPRTRLLATMHDASTSLANDLLKELREKFGPAVIPTVIRHDSALKSAASFGRPACDVAPESTGAADYISLCEWMIEHAEIDRASAEEMLEFENLEGLGRREAPGEGRGSPELRADRTVDVETTPAVTSPEATDEPSFTETISRLEDLTRRAKALQRTTTAIEPKPEGTEEPRPSDEALRSLFTNNRPLLPAAGDPRPGLDGPVRPQGHAHALTAARAGARIASAVATLDRLPRPLVLELTEDEAVPLRTTGVVDSVRRLLGVRRTSRGALFVQPITVGQTLSIAGSFNGWCAQTHVMRRNDSLGVFELQIELALGQHEYKLVVDNRWIADPYNPTSRPDDFGGVNSLVELSEARSV